MHVSKSSLQTFGSTPNSAFPFSQSPSFILTQSRLYNEFRLIKSDILTAHTKLYKNRCNMRNRSAIRDT